MGEQANDEVERGEEEVSENKKVAGFNDDLATRTFFHNKVCSYLISDTSYWLYTFLPGRIIV